MKLPERKECIHAEVCKYDDCMCPMECGHFAERSDNSDYTKLLDKMEKFAKECDDVGNNLDAKEVRSWIKQLRIIINAV